MAPNPSFDPAGWWARSGGAWLTGRADGPALTPTGDVGSYARAALAAISSDLPDHAADLLFGRAGFMGSHRDGSSAVGGTARIVRAIDGWVAVNLARPTDLSSVAAIIEGDDGGDPFRSIAEFAQRGTATAFADRAQLFGVPAAVVGATPATAVMSQRHGEQADVDAPRVADLTSLWAGPTCARLLVGTGAHVVKVESKERPDGARRGDAQFYAWLHREAAAVAYEFTTVDGRAALKQELNEADVVLESSRPRALRQLGVRAEDWLAARPGRVWLSIGGYGRDDPDPGRVAFGDDAAAAGGLVAYEPDGDGTPLFVGDAIADPLTGITAARAVLEAQRDGGGVLIHVSMAGVAADVVSRFPTATRATVSDAVPPQLPKADN